MKKVKKIAILGTRGVPAAYGGFETFAEELGSRLVKKGYEVTVYCRQENPGSNTSEYKGMKLIVLPAFQHKYLETISHCFYSSIHVLFQSFDVIYYCNAINSVFMLFPRLLGKTVVMNVDGLEWKRAKWNKLGQKAYQVSEWIATLLANQIISDSKRISLYYKKKFNATTMLISYGATGKKIEGGEDRLAVYGLKKRGYLLYVSRLEPENNAHTFIEAYERVKTDMPLIIVGHAPYGAPYIDRLRATKDSRIKFLGGVYGDDYRILISHAYIYLHGNEVGGTNPALLEAMSVGNCVIANGVGFNREVVGNAGYWYKHKHPEDLQKKLEYLLSHADAVERVRPLAEKRIRERYNWDGVAAQYDEFFKRL